MVIPRWDPFRELRRMEETMNRMWRRALSPIEEVRTEGWGIPLDVVQKGDNVVVYASLPGIKPDEMEVGVDNNVLTIKGRTASESEHREGSYLMRERRAGSFYRTLRLPDTIDTEKAKSVYSNGVLSITFPKLEGKRSQQLKIEVQDQDKTS